MTGPGWYLRRLSRMGPAEIAGRAVTAVRSRRFRTSFPVPAPLTTRAVPAPLPPGTFDGLPPDVVAALLGTAGELMAGRAEYFGVVRDDMELPDWTFDPKTGRRAPADAYAFDVPYRDEDAVGDIKQIWEPSRHQHLTVLAAAYAVTGDDRYAHRVADHLKSWWAANPPLRGPHWLGGIELGIRLLSWVWVRRLLAGWDGAAALFEQNPVAVEQVGAHQRWLTAFPSRGSSANNHVIAELAGQVAASAAFPWFAESRGWGADAMRALDHHLTANTFGSGLNRELASEYHGLVLELGLAAAVEADAAGADVPPAVWETLRRMTDALAAIVDTRLRPPRQGDADDGHGLVLDGTAVDRWGSLLATGAALFGACDWWPAAGGTDVRTAALAALARPVVVSGTRPWSRPVQLADAGMTVLRAASPGGEVWVRCDAGPHGFLAIAAHAHADALSVEVRHDGVDVLADPGTYCYHGEPAWRRYFRSTAGHNTLELHGRDQSRSGGPFLWVRHARSRLVELDTPVGGTARWVGEHDGYRDRAGNGVHRRTVELGADGALRIVDEVTGPAADCRLAFHLGPQIDVDLVGDVAMLSWPAGGATRHGRLDLPGSLTWTRHRGETAPPAGWYSEGFGRKQPSVTLIGSGRCGGAAGPLRTTLVVDTTSSTGSGPG